MNTGVTFLCRLMPKAVNIPFVVGGLETTEEYLCRGGEFASPAFRQVAMTAPRCVDEKIHCNLVDSSGLSVELYGPEKGSAQSFYA
jgi:hypothetical protein